jgi:chemotaxis protein CheD
MQDNDGSELPEVYLQPGDSHLATEPSVLRTLLGSCVGVAFWVPGWDIGALCHPMLPRIPVRATALTSPASCRYVDFAIQDMARRLDALGVPRDEVQVKLFGGADVLHVLSQSSRPTVGQMNQDVANQAIAKEGFRLVASRLGGNHGIHITFHTVTGEVLLRRLS